MGFPGGLRDPVDVLGVPAIAIEKGNPSLQSKQVSLSLFE